jgi:hypothetical protein
MILFYSLLKSIFSCFSFCFSFVIIILFRGRLRFNIRADSQLIQEVTIYNEKEAGLEEKERKMQIA